jgi:hypothetical protein
MGLATSDRTSEHEKHCKDHQHEWAATIVPSLVKCSKCGLAADYWYGEIINCPCEHCAPHIGKADALAQFKARR